MTIRGGGKLLFALAEYETAARQQGHTLIAGVDEAGRGALAGPVVVAAVILPQDCVLPGVQDSKQLTAKKREYLYPRICEVALNFAIAVCEPEVVDAVNVLRATHIGMRDATGRLSPTPDLVLVDGLPVPDLGFPQQAIVGGDAKSISIASASIIAKVARDDMMRDLDAQHPGYGFANHKGYATPEHRRALRVRGPCPAHRRSFAPVKNSAQIELPAD